MDLIHKILNDWIGKPFAFPERITEEMGDLVCVGGTMAAETVKQAYALGLFPWTGEPPIPWYSPNPRLILRPDAFKASHSLAKLRRTGRFRVVFDSCFEAVMARCAGVARAGQQGTWITGNMIKAYGDLHREGLAHSVEVYEGEVLVGGLYGLAMGRIFFGESMFSARRDTSKLALYELCLWMTRYRFELIDCQQVTTHLLSLGAEPIRREEYLIRLAQALRKPDLAGPWQRD